MVVVEAGDGGEVIVIRVALVVVLEVILVVLYSDVDELVTQKE